MRRKKRKKRTGLRDTKENLIEFGVESPMVLVKIYIQVHLAKNPKWLKQDRSLFVFHIN